MVLPPPFLYPSYQSLRTSHTSLPRVIEPSPPSPASTEGPDAADSDSSVYTASSSSSSFSFTSSSSFYATTPSSSSSDKVSLQDTVNRLGWACLFQYIWLSSFFLLWLAQPMQRLFLACCLFSPPVVTDSRLCTFLSPLILRYSLLKIRCVLIKASSFDIPCDWPGVKFKRRGMKANCFFVVVVILQIWFSLPFEEAVTGFCSSQTWRIRQYSHFPLFFFIVPLNWFTL